MTPHDAAVVDTNVIAALKLYDPAELPGMMLVTAVTLGELSFGPHATDDPVKRAGRVAVLQHVEATFDPLPYDQGAARLFGQICAAVRASGREPRKRASDLMIAATAASNELPLYTANPDDFKGAGSLRPSHRPQSTPKQPVSRCRCGASGAGVPSWFEVRR